MLVSYPKGCAAPGNVQGQCNALGSLSKLKRTPTQRKMNVTSKSPVGDISVVTLIRTDTTLDHSQKAEKVCSDPSNWPSVGQRQVRGNSFTKGGIHKIRRLVRLSLWMLGARCPLKNSGSHIDASLSRQPLVKGERLVRLEVNAVMGVPASCNGECQGPRSRQYVTRTNAWRTSALPPRK